jgi:hypothetical protein
VTYIANVVRSKSTFIKVDMWDSDSDPITLPIEFCGTVTFLAIRPAEITVQFCFINFPYCHTISVENKSDLDGYFCIMPQRVIAKLFPILNL